MNRSGRPLTAVALAVMISLAALPAQPATLQEELLTLLDRHPRIKGGQDDVSAADEAIGKAAAAGLPTVALTGDRGYKEIDGPSQRAAGRSYTRSFDQWGLTVTQNIFDGSRTQSEVTAAELNKEAVKGTLAETRQNILLEGANAYIEVTRQIVLVRFARRSEATIAERLDLEDERVQRGGGTAVDVLLSKTRLQRAKEQRIVFEGNLRDAITRYTQVFGHAPDLESHVDPETPAFLVPEDIDTAIAVALSNNPLVANSNRQIDIARARQQTVKSEYFPRVDVVGAANFEDDREGTAGMRRDVSVTLQATWNLFSGFATRSGIAEAAHGYSSTINNHLFVNRKIEEEVRLAWQGVFTACDRRLLLDNAVTISSEVYGSRVKLRDAGQETTINVLDAESEVFNAEINLVAATYDEKLAIYRLAIAMGHSLAEVLNRNIDEETRNKAKESLDRRCAERLQTVAVRGTPEVKPREVDNPFAAPPQDDEEQTDESGDGAANPFTDDPAEDDAADNPFADDPVEDDGVESSAADPFNTPAAEDDDEPGAENPFAAPSDEEEETGGVNPFAEPSDEPGDQSLEGATQPISDLISLNDDRESEAVESEIVRLASSAPNAMSRVLDGLEDEQNPNGGETSVRPDRPDFQWDDELQPISTE